MNEVFISSREKLPIYELDTLWATYGVTPVAVREDRVLLVRDEGLCWLTFDGSVKPMELPTVFTESDELHLAESRVIGTTVGEHDIAITTLDLTSGALKQTIQAITTPNFNLSYCVATLSYVTRIGIVAGAAYVDIFHVDIDGITHAAYGDVSMPEGFEVVSATPWHVVARADLGVAGDRVQIVSVKDGSLLVDVASDQGGGLVFVTWRMA